MEVSRSVDLKTRKNVGTNIGPEMLCYRVIAIFMLKLQIALFFEFFVKIEIRGGFYQFFNIIK